jgi:hypothetical protein
MKKGEAPQARMKKLGGLICEDEVASPPPLIPVTSNHTFPIVSYKKNFHLNGGRSACERWKICVNIDA